MNEETQAVHRRQEGKVERVTLREVFGVEGRSFNWRQVAVLFSAYLLSYLISDVCSGFYWGYPPASMWLSWYAGLLSFLVLAVLLFRFITSIPVVLVLSAVCHAPFRLVYFHFAVGVPDGMVEWIGLSRTMISEVLDWLIPLGLLALALRLIKRPGVALVAGAIVGGLALRAASMVLIPESGRQWFDLLPDLAEWASLGFLLWLGLIVTGRAPTPDGIARLSRSRLLEAGTDRPIFVWVLSIVLALFAVVGPTVGVATGKAAEAPPIAWIVPLAFGALAIGIWVGMRWMLVLMRVVWVLWCILVVLSALAASTIGGPDWSHALGLVCALLLIPIWFDSVKTFYSKTDQDFSG